MTMSTSAIHGMAGVASPSRALLEEGGDLVLIVGVTPAAATIVLLATTFLAIFQHANIKTPQWPGYVVQRPESHSVHHGRGFHGYNFADLPLFDLVFGTFRNPVAFNEETGFYPGGSERVLDMVLFKDISEDNPPVPAPAFHEIAPRTPKRLQPRRALACPGSLCGTETSVSQFCVCTKPIENI